MSPNPRHPDAQLGDEHVVEYHGARERRRRSGPAQFALNLTAMIDVVFLLLIYFMVSTEFKADEEVYRMDLPQRQPASAQQDPFQLDREPLRIEVASIGMRPGDYSVRLDGPYNQPGTFDQLNRFLDQRRIRPAVPGGLFEPDHPILIVASDTTRWEHVVATFNAAAKARYTNIMFGKPR